MTDKSLEALSASCSNTLKTLDVNGCINIKVCIFATTLSDNLGCLSFCGVPFGTLEENKEDKQVPSFVYLAVFLY